MDPVHADPEELTRLIEACRDLGDRRCEARALLARAECLHQSFPVASVMEDAAAAAVILRKIGPGAALGRALFLMGTHDADAEDSSEIIRRRLGEALDLARASGDRSLEGRVMCGLAFQDLGAGDMDSALARLKRIRALTTAAVLPRVTGCLAYNEGLGLLHRGKPAEARAVWDEFADSETAARASRERILVLNAGTVISFTALSDLEGAVARGRRARELADRLPGLADRARSYVNLASALEILGRFHEVDEIASKGLELSNEAGLQAGEAICLKCLGNAAQARGDYSLALQRCNESLDLSVRDADRFYALVCIAGALEARGDLETARNRIREAISVADRIGDVPMKAHGRTSLGRTYHLSGDPERAAELASEALDLLGPEGNLLGRAWALKTRGMARTGLQQHSLSLEDLLESFRLFGILGSTDAQAHVAIEMGNVQYYLNRPDRALDYYEQAVDLGREAGATEAEIIALGNIALSRGRFRRTSENRGLLLDRAREVYSHEAGALGANAMLNLADALNEIGEAEAAENVSRRALDLPAVRESRSSLARAHGSLATARSAQGFHDEAVSECLLALDLGGSAEPWTAISVHWGCGNVYLAGGRTGDALLALRKAVRIGEGARAALAQPAFRASFLSDRTDLYTDLVRAVLARAGPDPAGEAVGEALEISERFRAWTLLDALAGARRIRGERTEMSEPVDSKQRSELLADMAGIHLDMMTATPENRAGMLSEIRRLEDRLAAVTHSAHVPGGFTVLGGSSGTAADPGALLPDGRTAFLEYLLGHRASYVFVVTRSGIRVAELPGNRETVRKDLRMFRALIRRRDPDPDRDRYAIRIVGERLYRTLILPAEGMLDDMIRRLVICPDGALHLLPFEALIVPGDHPEDPFRYLVEKYQVTVAPSLGVYAHLRRTDSPDAGPSLMVAFANPETRAGYLPLPYSEEEVRIAARRIGGDARIFMGSRATEENARTALSGEYRVAHFAGHGFLDAGSIGRSGLVLTPDPEAGDDGLLQAREVVELDIGVDLVVLSGCSTGSGRLLPGEGPMGLPHAIFQAGAPCILMSLWDVRDRASAVFMDRFYANLAEERTVGEALRSAKLDLISSQRKELRHPSVWAPFVVAGVADRHLGLATRNAGGKTGTYAWTLGLLILSIFLWILSAAARRRSRNEPPRTGR